MYTREEEAHTNYPEPHVAHSYPPRMLRSYMDPLRRQPMAHRGDEDPLMDRIRYSQPRLAHARQHPYASTNHWTGNDTQDIGDDDTSAPVAHSMINTHNHNRNPHLVFHSYRHHRGRCNSYSGDRDQSRSPSPSRCHSRSRSHSHS